MRIDVHEEVVVVRRVGESTVSVLQSRTVSVASDGLEIGDDELEPQCDDCGFGVVFCRCMPGEG